MPWQAGGEQCLRPTVIYLDRRSMTPKPESDGFSNWTPPVASIIIFSTL